MNKAALKDNMGDARMKSALLAERRRFPRSSLQLPLDYNIMGIPQSIGGIAVNGSEVGLLLHCLRDMPVGTKLDIVVLFANGFELSSLEVFAEIVWRDQRKLGQAGNNYGLKLLRISDEDELKLKYVLGGLHEFEWRYHL